MTRPYVPWSNEELNIMKSSLQMGSSIDIAQHLNATFGSHRSAASIRSKLQQLGYYVRPKRGARNTIEKNVWNEAITLINGSDFLSEIDKSKLLAQFKLKINHIE